MNDNEKSFESRNKRKKCKNKFYGPQVIDLQLLSFIVSDYTYYSENNMYDLDNNGELSKDDLYVLNKYLKLINTVPNISKAYERILLQKVSQGCLEARNTLVEGYLPLVVNIAKKYCGNGMSLDDIIQEGTIGLTIAANKFDLAKGQCFANYSRCWIHEAIVKAFMDQGRTIRIPSFIFAKYSNIEKKYLELIQKFSRIPTSKELIENVDINKKTFYSFQIASLGTFPLEDIEDSIASINNLAIDVVDEECEEKQEKMLENFVIESFNEAYKHLDEVELNVIEIRFGIKDGISKTYEQTSELCGLSREWTRQIEMRALKKLNIFINN